MFADVEHELRCLRKWIKQTALRLQPLDFRMTWTLAELEEKAKEHEVRNILHLNEFGFNFFLSIEQMLHIFVIREMIGKNIIWCNSVFMLRWSGRGMVQLTEA